MKSKIGLILVLSALLLSLGTLSATAVDLNNLKYPELNKLKIPEIQKVTLDNGLRLYLVEDHRLPIFRLSARVNAGSYLEGADKVGMIDILGTVLRTGGTDKWTGDELDELLEGIGGSVETNGELATCGANVDVLSDYTDLGLEVLSQVLRHPIFNEDKLDLAKIQARSNIARRNDDPFDICLREFKNQIYGSESVYARYPEYATIDAITRDEMKAFHETYFRPENIQMAVWGDIDKEAIVARITELFGDWTKGSAEVPPLPEVQHTFENKICYIGKEDVNQANILMGHVGGLITDDDYADRIVMNDILGGGFGSRMFNEVRTKGGLAYTAQASYTARISYPGIFFGFVSTKNESTIKAIRKMIEVIKSMQTEPPTPEELKRAKDSYLNSFVFNFDSKAEVVNRLMNYDYYGIPDDFLQQQKEKIEKVTADDVVAAANRNLQPDKMRIVIVGKGSDFDEPAEALGYGPVDTVDITIPVVEEIHELEITPENLAKGDELFKQAVATLGGTENFKAVKSVSSKGTLTLVMGGREIPLSFEEIRTFPDQYCQLISFMGQKIYDIRNNDVGWKTDQATMGIVPKTAEELAEEDKEDLRSNILVFQQADNPTYRAVYDGSGKVEGTDVEYVALVDENDESLCRYIINAANSELVGKEYRGETPMGEGTITEVYSNFSQIGEVKLPMTVTRTMNGQKIQAISYSSYEINPADITEDSFNPPQ